MRQRGSVRDVRIIRDRGSRVGPHSVIIFRARLEMVVVPISIASAHRLNLEEFEAIARTFDQKPFLVGGPIEPLDFNTVARGRYRS